MWIRIPQQFYAPMIPLLKIIARGKVNFFAIVFVSTYLACYFDSLSIRSLLAPRALSYFPVSFGWK